VNAVDKKLDPGSIHSFAPNHASFFPLRNWCTRTTWLRFARYSPHYYYGGVLIF